MGTKPHQSNGLAHPADFAQLQLLLAGVALRLHGFRWPGGSYAASSGGHRPPRVKGAAGNGILLAPGRDNTIAGGKASQEPERGALFPYRLLGRGLLWPAAHQTPSQSPLAQAGEAAEMLLLSNTGRKLEQSSPGPSLPSFLPSILS